MARQEISAIEDHAARDTLVFAVTSMAMSVARQGILGAIGPVTLVTGVHAAGREAERA